MKYLRFTLVACLTAILAAFVANAQAATQSRSKPQQEAGISAPHDFDFLVGHWKTHHRQLKGWLTGSHTWIEFGGTFDFRLVMGGFGNVGDNVFESPNGTWRGVSLRSYNSKTGQWARWYLDERDPFANLDPPSIGRFENGGGTFYSDITYKGKPVRERVLWSHSSPDAARWEQAYSVDGGKTWETNWTTDFVRSR